MFRKPLLHSFIIISCLGLLALPYVSNAYVFTVPLEEGMEGSDVVALQEILHDQGFYTYPKITGYFTIATLQAVADFQRAYGLEGLGYVGPATRTLLTSLSSATSTPQNGSALTLTPPLAEGDVGLEIFELQEFLATKGFYRYPTFTGYFGTLTALAVEDFQDTHNIFPTGIVDRTTSLTITLESAKSLLQTLKESIARLFGEHTPTTDTTVVENAPENKTLTVRGKTRGGSSSLNESFIISNISVGTTITTADINWSTDEMTNSQVEYGTSTSYGLTSTFDINLAKSHSIQLTELLAYTTYHFRVRSEDSAGNIQYSSDSTFYTGEKDLQPIMLQKLRSDYEEFAVYTPLGGTDWVRWIFSSRFNPSLVGPARLRRASIAKLYKSTATTQPSANQSSGEQAVSAKVSQNTSAGSRTGTFTGPATTSGVNDIIFSETPGDTTIYTITIEEKDRIVWRTLGQASGAGIANITIQSSGVEIDSENYIVPLVSGERRIDLTGNSSGIQFITLASGLAAGTYTVEITVSADNPSGGKVFDGGIQTYPNLAGIVSTGLLGSWQSTTFASQSVNRTLFPGAAVIYPFTGTKIDWKVGKLPAGGIIKASIYDSEGVLVSTTSIDTYSTGNSVIRTTIASELDLGEYILTLEGLPLRNNSATGYRFYDGGVVISNEAEAGTLGVDTFDNLGQDEKTSPETVASTTVIGVGNIELAINLYKEEDELSTSEFVGGTHGHESLPQNFSMAVDGAVIDYDNATNDTTWIGDTIRAQFSTELTFSEDNSKVADVNYNLLLTSNGYLPDLTRVLTQNAIVKEDYAMMLVVPNTSPSSVGIDGGFELFGTDIPDTDAVTYDSYVDSTDSLDPRLLTATFYNDTYGVIAKMLNITDIDEHYNESIYQSDSRDTSSVQERSDGYIKYYLRPYAGDGTDGVLVPSGDVYRTQKLYTIIKR